MRSCTYAIPRQLAKKVNDLEIIVTDSEVEALVLENNLIKELKPRYNVNLKDDKSFPYIRITDEPYPQVFSTREIIRDGSKYIGPFTDVKSMKSSLRMINQIFKIRSCKYYIDDQTIEQKKIKLCLDYHINKCDGPCEGLISESDYQEMVNQVIKLLKGKTDDLIKELNDKMDQASEELNFEKAAEIRDKIDKLKVYSSKQKIVFKAIRQGGGSIFAYEVKKLFNMTEPRVSSRHKESVVQGWCDNKHVEVEIV